VQTVNVKEQVSLKTAFQTTKSSTYSATTWS